MKIIFLILFQLIYVYTKSQIISDGYLYRESGRQIATQSYIDKLGCRYQVVLYGTSFNIDSCGKQIVITTINNSVRNSTSSIAIIKYDIFGRYLFHFKLFSNYGYFNYLSNQNVSMAFNSLNEVYFSCTYNIFDKIDLIDSRGILYKQISNGTKSNNQYNYFATIICKLNSNGEFNWINNIVPETTPNNNMTISTLSSSLNVYSNNDVTVHVDNYRTIQSLLSDTISITDIKGQKKSILVNTYDVLIKFSIDGSFVTCNEPLKNRLNNLKFDTLYNQYFYNSISDGINSYTIKRINLAGPDTFRCATPLILKGGYNILLFKSNQHDSILWAKSIGIFNDNTSSSIIYENYLIDFDEETQEVAIGLPFRPNNFVLSSGILTDNTRNDTEIYLAKLDANGKIKNENIYSGDHDEYINSLTYNKVSKQLIMIGNTLSNNLIFGSSTISCVTSNCNYLPTHFICVFDSLNKPYSTQTINTSGLYFMGGINKVGYPITDLAGRTFISGGLYDSILLPCKKLIANGDVNIYSKVEPDGVVLFFDSYVPKEINTCKGIYSQSGKYFWGQSGLYYDTIPNAFGCDSVILTNLKFRQNKVEIDSMSCKGIRSYSNKYFWDNTGTYYDTIPNSYNCDSIIKTNFTVLKQSFASIDTNSCVGILSPSGRYPLNVSGIYKDTLRNHSGCDSIISINFKLSPFNIKVFKSNDISCDTTFATLFTNNQGKSYVWYPSEGLSDTSIASPVAQPITKTTYYVLVKDSLGCEAKDSIEIEIKKTGDIKLHPNVFTPNKDGYNDCIKLSTIAQFKFLEYTVFNRWGNIVYNTNDPSECWTGKTSTGEEIAEGVYFYILKGLSQCEQNILQRGSITVIK